MIYVTSRPLYPVTLPQTIPNRAYIRFNVINDFTLCCEQHQQCKDVEVHCVVMQLLSIKITYGLYVKLLCVVCIDIGPTATD